MKRHGVFYLFLTFILTAFLAIAPTGLHAQEIQSETPVAQEETEPQKKRDKMDDVPDEYIQEAVAYYEECESSHKINNYYNCECHSLAFLDERIKLGSSAPVSEIQQNINRQCRDAIGAAGPTYNECLRKANRFKAGTDPEKYCACVANTYVENVNRLAPGISSSSIVNFKTNAYITCNQKQRQ